MRLKGKAALVTGGSRGIGKGIALKMAQEGANTIVNYASNRDAADQTVEKIRAMGVEALAIKADVSNSNEVRNMVSESIERFGKIDILVNNAGIQRVAPLIEISDELWDEMLAIHLTGTFYCTREVAKYMIKYKSGSIINISSINAILGWPATAPYCAAKAGIIGFTKTIAKELLQYGIRVNAILPGYIVTDLLRLGRPMTQERIEDYKTRSNGVRLNRLGTPEDIGRTACFLASDEADYITGTVMNVSGGALI